MHKRSAPTAAPSPACTPRARWPVSAAVGCTATTRSRAPAWADASSPGVLRGARSRGASDSGPHPSGCEVGRTGARSSEEQARRRGTVMTATAQEREEPRTELKRVMGPKLLLLFIVG